MGMNKRIYSHFDRLLIQLQRGLTTVGAQVHSRRAYPAADIVDTALTDRERRQSGELMRVNHTGEVCAQALYYGQMAMAHSSIIYKTLEQAAEEETDHLAWTLQRLRELGAHPSYLNLFWYTQSYVIGLLAGIAGDRWSLGFIEETERQVTRHLDGHLGRLPTQDLKSRQIVAQMRDDEQRHGHTAARAGARPLPKFIQRLMTFQAKIMTMLAAKL